MRKTFRLNGLDCANCAAKIERAINTIEGVTSATVNFMTTKLVIEGDDARFDEIIQSSQAMIKKLEPDVVIQKA